MAASSRYWKLWLADGNTIVDSDGMFVGNAANYPQAERIANRHCSEIHGVLNEFKQKGFTLETGPVSPHSEGANTNGNKG